MSDLVKTIGETPLPTIFVVAGIACWILAIAGSIAGQITIDPSMRWTAQAAGTVFIGLGLALLYFAPPSVHSEADATAKTTRSASPSNPPVVSTPPAVVPTPTPAPPAGSAGPSFRTAADSASPAPAFHPRPSPGVNCNGTPDEIAICSNAQLRDLDWELHDLYIEKLKGTDQEQHPQLAHEESRWVKQRNLCASDVDCLQTAYRLRISQLRQVR